MVERLGEDEVGGHGGFQQGMRSSEGNFVTWPRRFIGVSSIRGVLLSRGFEVVVIIRYRLLLRHGYIQKGMEGHGTQLYHEKLLGRKFFQIAELVAG